MGNCLSPESSQPMLTSETKLGEGKKLNDDYSFVGDILGIGRVGTVREGVEKKTGRTVAIKVCSKKILDLRPARISRTNEIEAMRKLWKGPTTCHHVVELYGTFEDSHHLYLVMELAEGGDLFHFLAGREKLSEEDVAVVGRQILEAVAHCHACGVVHRDLKPENILLSETEPLRVKLVDFGSSALLNESTERLHDFMSTPFYAAPEVWEHNYGAEADTWSVGAVLYVLCTGLPPVLSSKSVRSNETWQNLQKGIVEGMPEGSSPALRDLLCRLLDPNPLTRITPAGALQHPWITGVAPRGFGVLEGSIRGLQLYSSVHKFQKAAVALLAVLLSPKETKVVVKKLTIHARTHGAVREVEVEQILLDLGLSSQATSLKLLREHMIGGREDVPVQFQVDSLLEFLYLRQLATSHLKRDAKMESSNLRPLAEIGLLVAEDLRVKKLPEGSSLRTSVSWQGQSGKSKTNFSKVRSTSSLVELGQREGSTSAAVMSPLSGVLEAPATVHGEKLYWKIHGDGSQS